VRVSGAGLAWGLASAAFFALYTLLGKYAAGRHAPWTLLAYGLLAASVFWCAYIGPARIAAVYRDPRLAAAVVFVAVVSTIVPFGAYLHGLHLIQATEASVTATLEPVVAGIGAFFAFGEALSAAQIAGGALVIAAILLVQLPAAGRELGVAGAGSRSACATMGHNRSWYGVCFRLRPPRAVGGRAGRRSRATRTPEGAGWNSDRDRNSGRRSRSRPRSTRG
jgi:uncharacterized membrane protein